uniref:Uncharacterized protein n=2 Tax=Talaromyces marneffei TaxID=37727 RepID=A0A093VDJ4_TALMA
MAENARFHGLIWQTGQSSQPLRDTYSRLPLRRAQQVNQGRYLLAQPPKEKSWTGTKAQSAKWSKQNTRPVIHRRPAKKTLVLEVIDQNDEEVEDDEERSSGK